MDISSSGNIVGGSGTAAQNIIVANRRNGITITGIPLSASNGPNPSGVMPFPQPVANLIEGNFIGTVAGDDDYGDAFDGIFLDQAAANTIGGTTSGMGNVVSNNGAGIVIAGAVSSGNLVAGNTVGTSADGTATLGNANDGISIVGAPDNIIGGTTAGAANVIAGNTNGVHLSGSGTPATSSKATSSARTRAALTSLAIPSTASPSTPTPRTTPSAARRPARATRSPTTAVWASMSSRGSATASCPTR